MVMLAVSTWDVNQEAHNNDILLCPHGEFH